MLFTYKEATSRRVSIRDLENGWYRIIPITEHRWLSPGEQIDYLYIGHTTFGDCYCLCWIEDEDCTPWLYGRNQPHTYMNGYGAQSAAELIRRDWPEYVTVLEKLS